MVGDRLGDRDAAWRHGVPHVHCAFGFGGTEEVKAEGCIEDLGELLPLLAGRSGWLERSLEAVGAGAARGRVIGITGGPAAGKSLYARDAARLLSERGHEVTLVSMDSFRRADPAGGTGTAPPEGLFDLEWLDRDVLEPCARERETLLLLEGPFLLEPRIRSRLDRVLFLDVDEDARARRLQARGVDEALGGEALRRAFVEHAARLDPALHADLVVDASNPLGAVGVSPAPRAGTPAAFR
jgi:dephospho-CoA kinase